MKEKIATTGVQDRSEASCSSTNYKSKAASSVVNEPSDSGAPATLNIHVDYLELPINSSNDEKEYRGLKLQNGLTAWLIAEPELTSSKDDNALDSDESSSDRNATKTGSSVKHEIAHAPHLAERIKMEELANETSSDHKSCKSMKSENSVEDDVDHDPPLAKRIKMEALANKTNSHGNSTESENSVKDETDDAPALAKRITMKEMADEINSDDKSSVESDSGDNDNDEEQCSGSSCNNMQESNAEQKMSECRLFVNVGSSSDPPEVPGMARFLQNMLVVGSKEQSQCFGDFTNSCGGWSNAFTESEKTTFRFVVPNKHLRNALERFTNLFVSPIEKSDSIINARQFMNLQDGMTSDQLYRELCEFRARHYRAHNMTFAMEGQLSLHTMEKHFKECFHRLPHEPLPVRYFKNFAAADLINISESKRIYRIDAIDSVPKIQFIWTIPSLCELSKSKPLEYVSWVLEHRGTGSLISYLKQRKYCQDVTSGVAKTSSGSQFILTLNLTKHENDENLCHRIIRSVYSYINLMRLGPQERMFQEFRKVEEIKLRFANEKRSVDFLDLCKNMSFKSQADSAVRSDNSLAYDPVSIRTCMDVMTPDYGNIIIYDQFSKEGSENVEPWFKTKYTDTEITKNLINVWKNAKLKKSFSLPLENAFLADDFTLIPTSSESSPHPIKIHSDRFSEIWYKSNRKSRDPKSYISCYLISPLPALLPENAAMLDVMVMILETLLLEDLYPASIAGLHYRIYASDKGVIVRSHGFSQKLPLVLKTITKRIVQFPDLITPGLFSTTKKKRLDGYRDAMLTNRNKLVEDVQQSIVKLVHWTTTDKYEAISEVKYSEFRSFYQRFFGRIFVLSLVQGNTRQTEIIDNIRDCVDTLKCKPLLPNTMPWLRVIEIPRGTHCYRARSSNSESYAIVGNFYQFDGSSSTLATNIELLNMIMADDTFKSTELLERTRLCPWGGTRGVHGYSVTAESCEGLTVEEIEEAIVVLRRSLDRTVRNLPRKKLLDLSKMLMNQKLKQHTDGNVQQDFERNWTEIASDEYMFDRLGREIEVLRRTDGEELRASILNLTGHEQTLRKLSVQVIGINDPELPSSSTPTDTGSGETTAQDGTSTSQGVEKQATVRPLRYVTHLPNEKKKPSDYFITDIHSYKAELNISPVQTPVLEH